MDLKRTFEALCRDLAARPDLLHHQFETEKKVTLFSMYFRSIRVQLVYSCRWEDLAPPSVLYCRIFLNKNVPLYLHLPELLGYLGADDYRACYFPCIETAQRMESCFRALMEVVDTYIPAAEALAADGSDRAIMEDWLRNAGLEPDAAPELTAQLQRMQEPMLISRFTTFRPYEAFLKGDREKALRMYRKMKKPGLSAYEQGLCRFMESEGADGFRPMPAECFSLPTYRKHTGLKADLKAMGILYLLCAPILCAVMAAVSGYLARDTLFYCGISWLYGLLLAVLPSIFGYYLVQKFLFTRFGKGRNYYTMMDNHPVQTVIVSILLALTLAGCLWFSVAVPNMSMRFYDTHCVCHLEESVTFQYTEVAEICHIDARYNDFGERIERSSYVLILSDGTQVDLDVSAPDLETQREIIETLFPHIPVTELDSDRQLP